MAFTLNNDYSPHVSEDISLFLRQLLNNCSSSDDIVAAQSSSLAHSGQINVGVSSSLAEAVPNNLGHLAGRSTIKVFDYHRPLLDPTASPDSQTCCYPNDALSEILWTEIPTADGYASHTEEGLEPNKQNQVRNSSKRTRAAEVHNMSEKRRRSRINEKMKALQNLIPNSNKTDKASMLDDAIEYLKQLQLQVQMLLVRHGLILHPMSLPGIPGVFDPVQIPQMGFNFSNVEQCDPLANQQLDGLAGGITEQAPFSLQSPTDNQIGSFHLPSSSQSFCGDDTMAQHQLSTLASQTTPLESMKPMLSSVSKYSSLSQGVLLTNCTSHVQLISSNLDGLCPGTTAPDDILDRKVGWKSEPGKLMF